MTNLQDLVRKVILGSLTSLVVANPNVDVEAKNVDTLSLSNIPTVEDWTEKKKDLKPKLLLQLNEYTGEVSYITHRSHRSHRSHSSHRSHYSSRTTTPRPSVQTPSTSTTNLGSRILKRGMEGKDVAEAMRLLIKKEYLTERDLKESEVFTEEVEKAVKAFQRDKNTTPSGVIGGLTVIYLKY